jgi:hypothetical protein
MQGYKSCVLPARVNALPELGMPEPLFMEVTLIEAPHPYHQRHSQPALKSVSLCYLSSPVLLGSKPVGTLPRRRLHLSIRLHVVLLNNS